jgi:hypothetical protein
MDGPHDRVLLITEAHFQHVTYVLYEIRSSILGSKAQL